MSKDFPLRKLAVLTMLAMCLALLGGVPVALADGSGTTLSLQVGSPNMAVNGVAQPIDSLGTAPVVKSGMTFVPIRAIVEALGGSMGYDAGEKKITISGVNTIHLWVGKTSALVNGQTVSLNAGPYISSGRTLVPLRFVTANLDCQVQWDGPSQTITIDYTPLGVTDPGATPADPGTTPADPGTTPPAGPTVDFSGTWKLVVNGEDMGDSVLVLEQSGSQVTGSYGYEGEAAKDFSGTVSGNKLTGKFSSSDPYIEWDFEATMSSNGNSFTGREHYSSPAWDVQGTRTTAPAVEITDFSGTWQLNVDGEDMGNYYLVLEQSGNQVAGYCGYDEDSGHAFSGTVTGNKLTGKFSTTNPVSEWNFEATMSAQEDSFTGKEYYSNPPWNVTGVKK